MISISTSELNAAIDDCFDEWCYRHQDTEPPRNRAEYQARVSDRVFNPVKIRREIWMRRVVE